MTERTKVVAFPHTSNLLGNVIDVAEVTRRAHRVGAIVVVDGVAYAPHALMEVAKWDVDFYAYSAYKVYGPHIAAMYGKNEAWTRIKGPNHFFMDDQAPGKFELGCLSFEACAGLVALGKYFEQLAQAQVFDRPTVVAATNLMRELETPLTNRLLAYLATKPDVRVVGPLGSNRVPTVSFVSDRTPSNDVAGHVNRAGIGIRNGHMYSYRLTEALGVAPDPGFVRVSAVHYNTIQDIDKLIEQLDQVL